MTIDQAVYQDWIRRFDCLSAADLTVARQRADALAHVARFDVVMPIHDPPEAFLIEAIASVRRQIYENWTLCIADDGSSQAYVRRIIEAACAADARVRAVRMEAPGGIARATNAASALGNGEFVVFFDHDDLLPAHALLVLAECIERRPDAKLLYSDFDFIDASGARNNPFFKPDYDHELHLGLNLVSLLTVFRRSLLEALGGMRAGFSGSEDYDLSLRAVERIAESTIVHIPHVLYHWRIVESSSSRARIHAAVEAARNAVREHCARIGIAAEVGGTARSMIWNRVRALPSSPPALALVASGSALERLRARTSYGGELSFVACERVEDLARGRNAALRNTEAELVAFIDPRLLPRDPEWLKEMSSHFVKPRTGAVGARVLAPDGTVEQSGVVLGVGQAPDEHGVRLAGAFAGVPDPEANYFGRAEIAHHVGAVSGGAIVVRRAAALEAGGYDEAITDPLLLDVDLCLRLRENAFSVVLCPYAVFDALSHCGQVKAPSSLAGWRSRWGSVLDVDPFYNPNLCGAAADYGLAFPPRVQFPWAKKPADSANEP